MKRFGTALMVVTGTWLFVAHADGQDKKLTDAEITKLLVGKWVQEVTGNVSFKMDKTVNKDGTYSIKGKLKTNTGDSSNIAEKGTWKVVDGKLQHTPSNPPVGELKVQTFTINEISDTMVKTKTAEKGLKIEALWKKVKE